MEALAQAASLLSQWLWLLVSSLCQFCHLLWFSLRSNPCYLILPIDLSVYLIHLVTGFCGHSCYEAVAKYCILLYLPVVLHNVHATNPVDQQVCLSPFAVATYSVLPAWQLGVWYCLWYCWNCNSTCLPFGLPCLLHLPLSLQLHEQSVHLPYQAWLAARPHTSCLGCGYWCLRCFLGVRMVPWPPVHRPSSFQPPACLVNTLGRWTVAQLPWWPSAPL